MYCFYINWASSEMVKPRTFGFRVFNIYYITWVDQLYITRKFNAPKKWSFTWIFSLYVTKISLKFNLFNRRLQISLNELKICTKRCYGRRDYAINQPCFGSVVTGRYGKQLHWMKPLLSIYWLLSSILSLTHQWVIFFFKKKRIEYNSL